MHHHQKRRKLPKLNFGKNKVMLGSTLSLRSILKNKFSDSRSKSLKLSHVEKQKLEIMTRLPNQKIFNMQLKKD